MAETLSILIGVPFFKPDDRFLESLPKFVNECKDFYGIEVITVPNKQLVDAQNYIVDYLLNNTHCDYLLLMEDDHYDHTKDMLDVMIKADKDVVSMNYYSRHFPHINTLMRELPGRLSTERFAGLNYTEGLHKVDLSGHGFILIKRDVFSKLDKPYFRINKDGGEGYATDQDFSDRLHEAGVDIWGCFDYILPHKGITKENRLDKFFEGFNIHRDKEINDKLNRR